MSVTRKMLLALPAVVLLGIAAEAAGAEVRCCARCGRESGVRKVCRPIYTTRKVEVTYWDCVSEDFCLPLRGKCDGRTGSDGAGNDGAGGGCGAGEAGCTSGCDSCAGGSSGPCAEIRTRNRLLRKTCVKEVPVVRWVVQYVCDGCDTRESPLPVIGPGEPVSPSPDVPRVLSPPPAPAAGQKAGDVAPPGKVRQAGLFQKERRPGEGTIRALGSFIGKPQPEVGRRDAGGVPGQLGKDLQSSLLRILGETLDP